MKKFLLAVTAFLCLHEGFATTYYSRSAGSVLTLTNWNTLSSGTGGANPLNFISGDIFIIQTGNSMTTPGAWTISGVGSGLQIQTGGSLTISNAVSVADFTLAGGTLTTNAAFSVSGNWTNNGGTFNNNANTVMFNGTNQEVAGTANTTFGSVTISSGCTLLGTKFLTCQQAFKLLGTGYFIQVLGTSFPANGTKTIDPTTTYEYRGAAASSWPGISGISFGNLIMNAIGTVSCGTNLTTVKGNLVVKSNLNLIQGASTATITGNLEVDMGVLNFNTLSGIATINVNGNIVLNGGTLNAQPSTSPPSFNVKGNWTINTGATFTPGTTTVTFNGSTIQTIDGTSAANFYSLALSATNGTGSLNLSNNINIANLLTLSSRKITTGSNTVTIGGSGAAISRSSGWINGNLAKATNSGASANYTYAIGDALNYTPVTLTFTNNATASGALTVSTTGAEHQQISSSGINGSKDVNRYWSIANSGLTFTGTYGAVFTFAAGDIDAGANTSAFGIYDYSNPNWLATTIGAKTSTTTQATGMAAFGDFAIGEVCLSLSSFSTSAASVCSGTGAIITVNSSSLTNGLAYTVTYNLSGTNIITGNTASLTLNAGTGTFNTNSLTNDGSTTLAITGILSPAGCGASIGSGNTAIFSVNKLPTIDLGTIAPICAGATVFNIPYTATSASLYSLSGAGIANVSNGTLATAPSSITVNLSAAATVGTIPFTITLQDATTLCLSAAINNSVAINPLPTLSGATQAATVISGTNAVINLVGLQASATSSINYTINGIVQPSATNVVSDATGIGSFNTMNLSDANNGQVLQITGISNVNGCNTVFLQNITLAVEAPVQSTSWTGTASTDWNNTLNWTAGIPTNTTDVIIAVVSTGNYPNIVSTGTSALAKTLTIQEGATITVSGGSELDVYGIVKAPKQGGLTVVGTNSKVRIIKTN